MDHRYLKFKMVNFDLEEISVIRFGTFFYTDFTNIEKMFY